MAFHCFGPKFFPGIQLRFIKSQQANSLFSIASCTYLFLIFKDSLLCFTFKTNMPKQTLTTSFKILVVFLQNCVMNFNQKSLIPYTFEIFVDSFMFKSYCTIFLFFMVVLSSVQFFSLGPLQISNRLIIKLNFP